MADDSSRRRKPRIRKAVPTVRQKIESGSNQPPKSKLPAKSTLGKPFTPFKLLWRVLARILRPLAPVGRPLMKILGWLVPRYFINSWRELRQVTWPNRRETWKLTSAVLVFSLVFGFLVTVVDLGLDQLFKRFVLK